MNFPFEPVAEPVQTTAGLLQDDFLLTPIDLPPHPDIHWVSGTPQDLSSISTLYVGIYGFSF